MTKFGKFKLRLIATINLSVLLSLFNIASITSNYWVRYVDHENGAVSHVAGLWRSCPITQGSCIWKNGIVTNWYSFWSVLVRLFILLGTVANVLVVFFLMMAFYYKINKRSKMAIRFMEWANITLISAFIIIIIGFCMFISNSCNYSMWLHVFAMIIIVLTSNMLTRTFARLYYMNTRGGKSSKSVETACSNSKLEAGIVEEKIALAVVEKEMANEDKANGGPSGGVGSGLATIEMNKISEANGSNEALLPVSTAPANVQSVNNVEKHDVANVA